MGQLMKNAKVIGRKIVEEIRQIADDEDTEVDGWLQERNGQLVNARGEPVGPLGRRA